VIWAEPTLQRIDKASTGEDLIRQKDFSGAKLRAGLRLRHPLLIAQYRLNLTRSLAGRLCGKPAKQLPSKIIPVNATADDDVAENDLHAAEAEGNSAADASMRASLALGNFA
jgi:hypothetical protein